MDTPYITIDNELKFMTTIKARAWRTFMQFEEERKDLKSIDAVEKYCEVIATAFGVTTDEVLNNLDIDEVLPLYFDILNYIVAMLTEKLVATNKKNAEVEVET